MTFTVDAPPLANAGTDQTVDPGDTVTLDGSGSRDASSHTSNTGGAITYSWARTGGTGTAADITLSSSTAESPTFTAPTVAAGGSDETHIFTLTVTDSAGQTRTDTVTITVEAPPGPMADAGPDQMVTSGDTVTLDGSGSTGNGLTYRWERQSGEPFTFSDDTAQNPTFTPNPIQPTRRPVLYHIGLTVTDSAGNTDTDTVIITQNAPQLEAEAGDNQAVSSGAGVTLTGSSNAPQAARISYMWSTTATDITLTDADEATATFTAPTLATTDPDRDIMFTLTIMSPGPDVETATDTVTITVEAPPDPLAPMADAGMDQTVASGTTVTLDGSGSSSFNDSLTYSWVRTGGTSTATPTLSSATAESPTFTADTLAAGASSVTHVFTLTVTDDVTRTDTDTVTITVTAPLPPSIAGAATRTVASGGTVQLSVANPASGVTYGWFIEFINGEIPRSLAAENQARFGSDIVRSNSVTFTAPRLEPGGENRVYTVHLLRPDANGSYATFGQLVTITVTPPSGSDPNDPIMEMVSEFMNTRSTVLLSRQPNLSRLTRAADGGFLNFELTEDGLDGEGEFVSGSIWGEITGSQTNADEADGGYLFMAYGAHQQVTDSILFGGMVQYDQLEEEFAGGGTLDGSGWLIGPYFVLQPLDEQPLHISGSVLYGVSNSDIVFVDSAQARRNGSFDSERIIANLNVSGQFTLEDMEELKLLPYVAAAYITDESESFTDNNGVRVLGQSLSITQFDLGTRFEIPVDIRSKTFHFRGGKGVIFSLTDTDLEGQDVETRSKVELGVEYDINQDLSVGVDAFYDGLYNPDFTSWGANLGFEAKF